MSYYDDIDTVKANLQEAENTYDMLGSEYM